MGRKLSERERTAAPKWSPYLRYVWTLKQLHAWIDEYGPWAFYDGEAWAMGNKRIAPNRYEVWFYTLPN